MDSENQKYGQLADNKDINSTIYRCFEHVEEEDAARFVKKFHDQQNDDKQALHTFRELILGSFMRINNIDAHYEKMIDGLLPEWSVYDENNKLSAIVELMNFHLDAHLERSLRQQKADIGMAFWIQKNHSPRLLFKIEEKVQKYRALARENALAFILAIYGDFAAGVAWKQELYPLLLEGEHAIFPRYPELSGLLHFDHSCNIYDFNYIRNDVARRPFALPNGKLF
jgi:hypothetical protein